MSMDSEKEQSQRRCENSRNNEKAVTQKMSRDNEIEKRHRNERGQMKESRDRR